MERVFKKAGVSGLVALVGVVVVLYALWGASVLHAQQPSLSQASSSAFASNL